MNKFYLKIIYKRGRLAKAENPRRIESFSTAVFDCFLSSCTIEYFAFVRYGAPRSSPAKIATKRSSPLKTSLLVRCKVQIESYRAGIFKVSLNTPSDGSEWEVDSSGRHILEMNVNVVVESDLGCQNGNCLTTTMIQQIIQRGTFFVCF